MTIGSKDNLVWKTMSQEQERQGLVTNNRDGNDHPKKRNQPSSEETGGAAPTDQPLEWVVQEEGGRTPHPMVSVFISRRDGTWLDQARPTASLAKAGCDGEETRDGSIACSSPLSRRPDTVGDEEQMCRGGKYHGDLRQEDI